MPHNDNTAREHTIWTWNMLHLWHCTTMNTCTISLSGLGEPLLSVEAEKPLNIQLVGPPKLISGRSYERIFFCRLFSTGSLFLRLTKVVFSLPSAMETCTACGGLCICLHRSLCRNADQGEWLVLIGPGRDLCHLLRMRSATRSDRHLISGLPPINCAAN